MFDPLHLDSLVIYSPNAVLCLDATGKCIYANPTAVQIFGDAGATLFFDSPLHAARLNPSAQIWHERVLSVIASGLPETLTLGLPNQRWFDWQLQPAPTAAAPVAVFAYAHEITHLREMSRSLREAQTRWQLVLECTQDGIWDWDCQHDTLYLSPQWKALLGYNESTLSNHFTQWEQLIHPQDSEPFHQYVAECAQGLRDEWELEYRLRTATGEWAWMLNRARVVARGENGLVERIIGLHTDISTRKRSEQRKHASMLELLRTLINAVPETLMLFDASGTLLVLNETAAQRSTKSAVELIGMPLLSLWSDKQVTQQRAQYFQQCINSGIKQYWDDQRQGRHYHHALYPLRDEHDKVYRAVWFAIDITEQILSETRLRENEQRFRDRKSVV